jgi:hypothetical protein
MGTDSTLADKLLDVGDLLEGGIPEPQWVGPEGRYSRGAITVTGGYSGVGKTPLTIADCRATLSREDFLGYRTTTASRAGDGFKIAYLTQETETTFLPALGRGGLDADVGRGRMRVGFFHSLALDDWTKTVVDVAEWLDGDGLLVVDTLTDWSKIDDENSSGKITAAFQPLQIAAGSGVAVGVNMHAVKSSLSLRDEEVSATVIRGSGAAVANASLIFTYTKANPAKAGEPRTLKMQRSRLKYDRIPQAQYVVEEAGELRRLELLETHVREVDESARRLERYLADKKGREAGRRDAGRDLGLKAWEMDAAVEALGDRLDASMRGRAGWLRLL